MTHQCGSCADAGCTGLCRGEMTTGEGEVRRATWAEALEAAACEAECGCSAEIRAEIVSLPSNSGPRWSLCGEANCGAILAAQIRALPLPERGA